MSSGAIKELKWWDSQIGITKNKIRSNSFDLEIFSDASKSGWGATCGKEKANGLWNKDERMMHINYLEIKAAFLALRCFASSLYNQQILLRIDNITALAYINKMGGIKYRNLHIMSKEIWEWCQIQKIWLFAEYVASKENPADEGSRISNPDTEWELANHAFNLVIKKLGNPTIDLFASRINKKCPRYCSWERDPDAAAINAFTISWKHEYWYAFPPFALISKILKKVREEGSSGILVVPLWTGQPWFPVFTELRVSKLIEFKPCDNLLLSPCRTLTHPLAEDLTLFASRKYRIHFKLMKI